MLPFTGNTTDAPPTAISDDFATRTRISGSRYRIHADNSLATAEASEPGFPSWDGPNHSLWWTWTAPKDEIIAISSRGSAVNTVLAVYEGESLDSLTRVTWSIYYKLSEVVFHAHAGTTYQIMVDSFWGGSTGKVVLNLFPAPVPRNDNFANRKVLVGRHANVAGRNRFATLEEGESYAAPQVASLWYSWTSPKTGVLTFTFSERNGDEKRYHFINVFTGDSLDNLLWQTELAPGDWFNKKVVFPVVEGTTYQMSVSSYGGWTSLPADSTFHLGLKFFEQ